MTIIINNILFMNFKYCYNYLKSQILLHFTLNKLIGYKTHLGHQRLEHHLQHLESGLPHRHLQFQTIVETNFKIFQYREIRTSHLLGLSKSNTKHHSFNYSFVLNKYQGIYQNLCLLPYKKIRKFVPLSS